MLVVVIQAGSFVFTGAKAQRPGSNLSLAFPHAAREDVVARCAQNRVLDPMSRPVFVNGLACSDEMKVVDDDHATHGQPRIKGLESISDPVVGVRIDANYGEPGRFRPLAGLGRRD